MGSAKYWGGESGVGRFFDSRVAILSVGHSFDHNVITDNDSRAQGCADGRVFRRMGGRGEDVSVYGGTGEGGYAESPCWRSAGLLFFGW